jgi:hypothetical protein
MTWAKLIDPENVISGFMQVGKAYYNGGKL